MVVVGRSMGVMGGVGFVVWRERMREGVGRGLFLDMGEMFVVV